MDVKTQAVDRVLDALSPALAAEINRVVEETREALEQEFQARLQTAIREAETAATSKAQGDIDHSVEQAKEETRRQVAAELEQQFDDRLQAATAQARNEGAEERARLETAMAEQKNEWSTELSKLEDERDRWRNFAEAPQGLAEASSQREILFRFLKLAQPFAEGLAVYVNKGEGLSLWKSSGNGVFPEIISKQTTDPDSYFRILSVRGQVVGALCARSFKGEALDFLAGTLERAIELFGLRLRSPLPRTAGAEKQ